MSLVFEVIAVLLLVFWLLLLARLVFDLVEEYGRHTGHADLLREAIDGVTGEDPPGDMSWPRPFG